MLFVKNLGIWILSFLSKALTSFITTSLYTATQPGSTTEKSQVPDIPTLKKLGAIIQKFETIIHPTICLVPKTFDACLF